MSDTTILESPTAPAPCHLHDMRPGECGTVVGFRLESAFTRRLIAMGVLPGRPVTVLRTALFADPIHVEVGGCCFSLRRSDAAQIVVTINKQP